jgi:hypothetical protein
MDTPIKEVHDKLTKILASIMLSLLLERGDPNKMNALTMGALVSLKASLRPTLDQLGKEFNNYKNDDTADEITKMLIDICACIEPIKRDLLLFMDIGERKLCQST